MDPQVILNGLIAGATYALVAIGFTLVYRSVRFFHFAHGTGGMDSGPGPWTLDLTEA